MNPHYSIIIPVHNHLDLTIQCLRSIERNSNMKSLEVILVDDGSTDGTREWAIGQALRQNYILIDQGKREGFVRSCNVAMQIAKGDYILLLNNDTLVSPNWLQHLENSLLEARKRFKNPNFALIGPVSNNVPGSQLIKTNAGPEDVDKFGNWHYENNKNKIKPALFLSGFCLMFTKALYQKIGPLDERFSPGGYEDRDFCLRARMAGYLGIIALDTFIYHHGHRTIDEFPELNRGHHNRWKYIEKWRDDKPKKLVAAYFVENIDNLRNSLISIHDAVDEIVILDSSHIAHKRISEFPKVVACQDAPIGMRRRVAENKLQIAQTVSKLVQSREPDWTLFMDADFEIEPKLTREIVEKMMNPLIPDILAYEFSLFHTQDCYICPQRIPLVAMQRNLPNANPLIPHPTDSIRPCPFKINKWASPERHLPLVANYENSISLVTIMKDEAKGLDSFLEHIYLAFDEIILVDTGSTDSSKKIAERWGAKVVDFKWRDHFGIARNFALNLADTEWVFQLDIDEKVEDIRQIYDMINSGKDAFLFTIADFQPEGKVSFPSSVRLFRKQKGVHYQGMIHETVVESLQRIKGLQVDRATTKIAHYGRIRPGAEKRMKYYRELVENALRRNQNDPLLHFHQGLMDRDAKDMQSALRHLQQAADTGWEKPIIRMELANTHLLAAYTVYKTLSDMDPGDPYYQDVMRKLEILGGFFPE